jgi:hypothetical protein
VALPKEQVTAAEVVSQVVWSPVTLVGLEDPEVLVKAGVVEMDADQR